ncbi:MAG TPA: 2TM domain-containing protein [Actinomycetota bacterium]|jgi:hypothetical protein|nr:2TM domain-containing protein [Actinomycetota bacterium]
MDAFERAAQRELDAPKLGFRIHFAVYIGVQVLLIATWALVSNWDDGIPFPWPIFPLLGWGIGVAAHYVGYAAQRRHYLREQPPAA